MFIVFLKFSKNKIRASEFMAEHNASIQRGFDDGGLLMAGSLQPGLGGALLARHTTLSDLETRIGDDPFVRHDVVSAEIMEVEPSRTDPRLDFVREASGK